MNAFDTMNQALAEAEDIIQQADDNADKMAKILRGRLRKVSL